VCDVANRTTSPEARCARSRASLIHLSLSRYVQAGAGLLGYPRAGACRSGRQVLFHLAHGLQSALLCCQAQPIRLVLAYAGVDYEDKLYSVTAGPDGCELSSAELTTPCLPLNRRCRSWESDWSGVKHSLGLDFPNLPYYIDGELKLTQSHAILQHVAEKAGLAGSTPAARARSLMLLELSRDVRTPYVNFCYSGSLAGKDALLAALAPTLGALETYIATTPGPFLMEEFTYVDLVWADLLEQILVLSPSASFATLPRLTAFQAHVAALPAIAAYRASGQCIDRPFNNKMAVFK